MTIEEKARAYDEAFEKAKKHYNSKYHPSEGPSGVYLNNADLEEIFPALKQSEDERIRNRIICYLKQDIEEYPERTERIKEMLAYLERQKEQKPAEWSEEVETNLDRAINIIEDAKGVLPNYQTDDGIYECEKAVAVLREIAKNGLKRTDVTWNINTLTQKN